jgi:hypothetical protein
VSQPTADESDNEYRPIPSHAIYLIALAISVTAALILLGLDIAGALNVIRGVYALLGAAITGTFVGYVVRSEGDRVLRRMAAERRPEQSSGLDGEAIGAARSLARQLISQR